MDGLGGIILMTLSGEGGVGMGASVTHCRSHGHDCWGAPHGALTRRFFYVTFKIFEVFLGLVV